MNVKGIALLLALAGPAFGQGFAGLGQTVDGFAEPRQGRVLSFPQDHGAHPAFRIEWWYVTANLTDSEGQEYGVQWTVFRNALSPEPAAGWASPQLWMGHAAVTTDMDHLFAQRLARGGVGQAGAQAQPISVWIDEWQLSGPDMSHLSLRASDPAFSYDLSLHTDRPLVLHGDGGYSVKSDQGQASHYYAQPWYSVNGVLTLDGDSVQVSGQAWLDREWSSQPLAADQTGWDWFSLHLEDGAKLMAFRLRDADQPFISGSWVAPDGRVTPLSADALRITPLESAGVPTRWALALPEYDVEVTVEALNPDSWMNTLVRYWEGPVRVSGSHNGRGYLEMTGY